MFQTDLLSIIRSLNTVFTAIGIYFIINNQRDAALSSLIYYPLRDLTVDNK